jgi:UDP-GlcNAc:undecaprenyl-phosphate GlcNAc-1-phosphate transferase
VALLSAALAGCLLGFLRYNFHPATIFMGDSGSTFIGFMLAALSITGSQKSSTVIVIFIPFLIMAVPILDTFIAVIRRLISGRHIFEADREHIHHKLLDKGLKQNQIAFILYGIAALLGFYSLIFVTPSSRYIGYSLLFVFIVLIIAIQKIGYEEFKELFRYVAVGLRFQGKQLSSQIKFRKLFNGELNNAKDLSLDGVFDKMKNAFDEYGFDSLRLYIEENGSSNNDKSFFWKKNNGQYQKDPWEITVPLEFNHDKKAFLTLTYANGYDALPMRLSFIVQDLPDILVDTLEKCYDNGVSKIKTKVNDKT